MLVWKDVCEHMHIYMYQLTSRTCKYLSPQQSLCQCQWASYQAPLTMANHRLDGLVVMASALRAEDLGFKSHLWQDFCGSSHTSDSKIDTPVATLQGTWRHRVSTGTGQPGVSILWLGEIESLICNFYLSVAACKIVWADPFLRYTSLLLGC